ncbi:hypothetical protein ANHYDRO_00258 [Anaerococcus hydrogenalis DSM 7454]|uniref:Uncharacterized protein n=1 Tax=Anaerococcus hydrogenalis DSM 7454 TaxID=561177 RepID=B6W6S3_9FIRM|nr:hypothetical protein ANHYDRO_00258 [Anaerococcus hydrogenalis DSM 7454]
MCFIIFSFIFFCQYALICFGFRLSIMYNLYFKIYTRNVPTFIIYPATLGKKPKDKVD